MRGIRKILAFLTVASLLMLWGMGRGLCDEHDYDLEWWAQSGTYSIGPITVDQAKQIILNWAGRGNLEIELAPVYEWDEHPARECAGVPWLGQDVKPYLNQCYVFYIKDNNPDHKYTGRVVIDSYTGNIVSFSTQHQFQLIDKKGDIANMLPPQTIVNLAKQYVASYFPNIPLEQVELQGIAYAGPPTPVDGGEMSGPDNFFFSVKGEEPWKAYSGSVIVMWENFLHYGDVCIDMRLQQVSVELDSETGQLCELKCVYEPLEINPQPTLSDQEVEEIVLSHFYGLGYTDVSIERDYGWSITRIAPNGRQVLSKWLDILAYTSDGTMWAFWVKVDGHTGEIWQGSMSLGGLPPNPSSSGSSKTSSLKVKFDGKELKLSSSPVRKNGKLFLAVADIQKMGIKLNKLGKGLVLLFRGQKVSVDNKDILTQGKNRYVNVAVLGKIKNMMVNYNENLGSLNIWVKNEKAYNEAKTVAEKLKKNMPKPPANENLRPRKTSANPSLVGGGLSLSALGYAVWKFLKLLS